MNNCDENSVCFGKDRVEFSASEWQAAILENMKRSDDDDENERTNVQNEFTCECKKGYIRHLGGSVCIENKFQDKYMVHALKGGIAVIVVLFVIILVMGVICFRTKDRRGPVCGGKRGSYEVNQ